MPTMRELAVVLKVDLNTVRHAYDSAQEMGGFILVRRRGIYVADRPPEAETEKLARKTETLSQQTIAITATAGINLLNLITCRCGK